MFTEKYSRKYHEKKVKWKHMNRLKIIKNQPKYLLLGVQFGKDKICYSDISIQRTELHPLVSPVIFSKRLSMKLRPIHSTEKVAANLQQQKSAQTRHRTEISHDKICYSTITRQPQWVRTLYLARILHQKVKNEVVTSPSCGIVIMPSEDTPKIQNLPLPKPPKYRCGHNFRGTTNWTAPVDAELIKYNK